ncbi:MAG: energy-coupling factor transporter transmembrane protein EcfT [Lachnospiraceae bacterium]|nr:energy-coupling factor transporter transmembrane protein EcfT [Lachnospiraceae bacterium]
MIRDITLGQYYPAESVLHKLDPRLKITGTFLYIISLFLVRDLLGYAVAGVFLAIMIAISHVPFKFMIRGLKGILVILFFTAIFNVFFTPGEVLLSLWKLDITKEGIRVGVRMVIRLVFLVIGSSIMTLTTTPNRLTDGLERVLKPLQRFKLPVHEVAMMMSIALGFIPILVEELDKIMKAQSARGADFESSKLAVRIKSMIPILVPLFVSAFRRAGDLATAMEARCYHGGEGRTKLKPLRYMKRDYIAYLLLFVYLGIIIMTGIMF